MQMVLSDPLIRLHLWVGGSVCHETTTYTYLTVYTSCILILIFIHCGCKPVASKLITLYTENSSGKCRVVHVDVQRADVGPRALTLDGSKVSFTSLGNSLFTTWTGPQSQSGHSDEEKSLCLFRESTPVVQPIAKPFGSKHA
jgi:hypothetical protein